MIELLSFPIPEPGSPHYKIARLIALATGYPYCHSAIRKIEGPDDLRCFSSGAGEGVHWRLYGVDEMAGVAVRKTPLVASADTVAWINSILGAPYDWLGALMSAKGRTRNNSGAWFCSEAAAEGMSRCSPYPAGIPMQPNPGALDLWTLGQPWYVRRNRELAAMTLSVPDLLELNMVIDLAERASSRAPLLRDDEMNAELAEILA